MTTRQLAALMAAPALVVSLGLVIVEARRAVQPQAPLFVPPRAAYSLGEAIAAGNLQEAFEFVRAGQDPNGLLAVRDEDLTGDRRVVVSPLLWAVANRNRDAVQMLFGYGARIERPADRRAVCLAETLGSEDIARLLRTHDGGRSVERCVPLEPGAPPLLRVLADEE